jgi:uncharacterized membrane protein
MLKAEASKSELRLGVSNRMATKTGLRNALNDLINAIYYLLSPHYALISLGSLALFIGATEWTVALLSIPLAAVVYAFTPDPSAARDQSDTSRGTRRLIVVGAIISLVVLGVTGAIATFPILESHVGPLTADQISYLGYVRFLLSTVWGTLLDALPVAIATLAMVDAARAGRRAWVTGLIVLAVLDVLVAGLSAVVAIVLILLAFNMQGQGDVYTYARMPQWWRRCS